MHNSSRKIEDEMFMLAALNLARKGAGWVDPNPMVGCVIVRAGEIIGRGYHTKYGDLHAEREALSDCTRHSQPTKGATAYVTLEPCSHTGKQPPCTEVLIKAGIKCVVVGRATRIRLCRGVGLNN